MGGGAVLVAAAVALAGDGPGDGFDPTAAPAGLRAAVDRAERAIQAAACDVERRFGEGDPDVAATRCEGAARPEGVTTGRTSARLRNPRNAPPAWAAAWVDATDGRKASDVSPRAFDLGDRVGLLRPIEVRRRCLGCHAPAEALDEGTRAWLRRSYPEDRALGYALGDLRGFWWAEAPKVVEAAPRRAPAGAPPPDPR
jgi:uncharacterized protein DUF3365